MKPDEFGFLYPEVDESKCVGCGLCNKACGMTNDSVRNDVIVSFAMRNKNDAILMSSRSGGVFPSLASRIIIMGGAVYGAAFDDEFNVKHNRAETEDQCLKFRGSKYVQSDLRGVFRKVIADLKDGRPVLFSGTPCQIDGLNRIIPDSLKTGLYLADIVCHGVPSPRFWQDNLKRQRNKLGGPLTSVNFRDKKEFGWTAHIESYSSADKTNYDEEFTFFFYKHLIFRDSCHSCPYAAIKRVSDITLGDLWGWQKVAPESNPDDRGISLILVNTPKGRSLLDLCMKDFDAREVELEKCLQQNLLHPSQPGTLRSRFIEAYLAKGYDYVRRHYGRDSLRNKYYCLYLELRRFVRKLVGKK